MASLLTSALVALLLGAAVLHLAGQRALGCWLLVLFPALISAVDLADLAHGTAKLGTSAAQGDEKLLAILIAFLAVSVVAALKPGWKWLFWAVWALNALVCGAMVYLAFFWKVFS
jgi:hypothetical protein